MPHLPFHSSINELSGYSHILAIVNNATMNTRVHVSFGSVFSFPSDKYPELELLDPMVVLFFIFEETSILSWIKRGCCNQSN